MELIELRILRHKIDSYKQGILFHFGTSMISQIIMRKTRQSPDEVVPSHAAMVYNGYIYESTSADERINGKTIPSGVRRYLLRDFFKKEKEKDTKYYYYPFANFSRAKMEQAVHKPYGKDIIIDFLIKDESDGDSKGLICSQYVNLCTNIIEGVNCPSPAELFRAVLNFEGEY